MLRAVYALLSLTVAAAGVAQAVTSPSRSALQQQIQSITQEPAVARAHWGVSVTTLSGQPAAALNEGQFFQPASNTKLFTTAAAIALLPMDEHLKTDVIATGYLRADGTLAGSLTIRGVGDANLSGRPVPFQPRIAGQPEPARNELRYIDELADKVKAAGVTSVTGDVIGDDSLFPWDPYPADWAVDDTPWYYGAPINALMIADNSVTLTVTPGLSTAAPAQASITPSVPYYTLDLQATTGPNGSGTQLEVQRSLGERTIHIYGTLASDAQPYVQDMSIADPAEYAAMALAAALRSRGIAVQGQAVAQHSTAHDEPSFAKTSMQPVSPLTLSPERTRRLAEHGLTTCPSGASDATCQRSSVIAEHISTAWSDDIAITNKTSQNQHAELLLRQLGFAYGVGGTTVGGARVVRTFLTTEAGIDPADFVFYDGSGLSGHDLVTPRAITQLLRFAITQPWGAPWKASLPIGGVDGSLRNRFTDPALRGHIFAKTGTLGEARALSGYLQCRSGRTVAFSILVSTHTPLDNEDEHAMDRIVAAIAAAE